MNKVFVSLFQLIAGCVAAITPCSIVPTIIILILVFAFGVGRRSAMEGEDSSETPTELATFCVAILFGSLVNCFMLALLGTRR